MDSIEQANRALVDLACAVGQYRSLDDLLAQTPDHLRGVVPFDLVVLSLKDSKRDVMIVGALSPQDDKLRALEKPVDFGPTGRVWRTQRSERFTIPTDPGPDAQFIVQVAYARNLRGLCLVPVSTPRSRVGVLIFGSTSLEAYSDEMVATLERVATIVALAVEHARHDDDLRTVGSQLEIERDRARLLLEITTTVAAVLDLPALLQAISGLLRHVMPHHFASLTLWDEQAGELRRHALEFPTGKGLIENGRLLRDPSAPSRIAFDRGETMVFLPEDVARTGQISQAIMAAEGLQAVCCVPLTTARGKFGTLSIGTPDPTGFPREEVQLLEQIGHQLSMAIDNARQFELAERYRQDATRQRDRVELLLGVSNELVVQHDERALCLAVLKTLRRAVEHDYAGLTIYDAEAGQLRVVATTHYDERGVEYPDLLIPLEGSPSGEAFRAREPRVFTGEDVLSFRDRWPALRTGAMQTVCSVPLIARERAIGTVTIASHKENAYSPDDVRLLVDVAAQVAIATDNALAYQQIAALKDKLAEENLYLESEVRTQAGFEEIVGTGGALAAALQQIRTVAATDATVLLLGETGTGKELLARAVHTLSRRRDATFVRLNGAALPATLVESELFGYDKGAFTGAVASKVGRMELAHRGTLFLDEIGDLPLDVQPKLLRVLQEQEFERLGSARTQRVDVRLIAATHRDLGEMVADGRFRSDLFYRLNVFPIRVPPLRERREDIPSLVHHFAGRFARELGRQITTVPVSTMDALRAWHWPGNIRELENIIERAVIVSTGTVLQVPLDALELPRQRSVPDAGFPIVTRYADGERDMILRVLRETRGVVSGPDGAAARLGVKRTTLQSKMRRLGIERPSY